ncbi:methyltransferase TYW3-domain-containing protein [Sordaria brevicollis]|uniref:tRNA(Phe) 7-[(3-amino-3-carboxypropyl)-4-demethylwyosine(37)-N(4)]-methyltransferase n=1 Tax=Sordaria brevicollis TaxID=83679 RepID=A0AAE0P9W3_SORBR|nr:methyltransferase TYW3-domain-containing protein [Sordaria brevicollis]
MLPQPTPSFLARKSRILSQLSVPDAEYTDASPKGSVDVAIRELIDEINHGYQGLVTTSSCAGRVSVYLEGVKRKSKLPAKIGVEAEVEEEKEKAEEEGQEGGGRASSSGGKGGGEWLFVSHDPLETVDSSTGKGYDGKHWMEVFGLTGTETGSVGEKTSSEEEEEQPEQERLIHFKFEPMILHILTTSPSHAHLAIQSGMTSGFRETGAVSILPRLPAHSSSSSSSTTSQAPSADTNTPNPIVAIRSMGLSFESLIGVQRGSHRQSLVTPEYLSLLVKIANERFEENKKRIARFREALRLAFGAEGSGAATEENKKVGDSGEWEDAEARKQRKREEGLARREEVRKRKEEERERKRREAEEAEKKKKDGEDKTTLADVVLQVPDVL